MWLVVVSLGNARARERPLSGASRSTRFRPCSWDGRTAEGFKTLILLQPCSSRRAYGQL
ncbi:unnamed protein product, partial [Nesidiocoris tenuis]